MRLLFSLIVFLLLIGCKDQNKFDQQKQDKLSDLGEQIFHLKEIDSKRILKLIKENTSSKFKDTAYYFNTPEPTIYANNSAKIFFRVFEKPKGIIRAMFFYKNGKRIYGAEYFKNGLVMCQFKTNRAGVRNGKYTCYHKNGRVRIEGELLNDKNVGLEISYDSLGNIKNKFDYSKK